MISIPKGTKDVLPGESHKWHYVETTVRNVARRFCLGEIRTPVFEHTELFLRGVGETTDVVNKEMYTFNDKGNRSITLKPEGTAGVARSYIENSLYALPQPLKTFYITPVFRYERPQSGRLREHHQFGVEIFGSPSPIADAEAMMIAKSVFDALQIKNLTLFINSIGCAKCRADYNAALCGYLEKNIGGMCPTCNERLHKNPLRILDCKEERCKAVTESAPSVLDYICADCAEHHNALCAILDSLNVKYKVNPRIVRGLDYYTRTVFEFVSDNIGAQGTVCGGGRYDNLTSEVGGKSAPAVGFGMGLERLLMTMENLGLYTGETYVPDLYVAPITQDARAAALSLCMKLRNEGLAVDTDYMDRSLKAQLKFANKLGARFIAVIGEEEMQTGSAKVKNMDSGEENTVNVSEITAYIEEKTK